MFYTVLCTNVQKFKCASKYRRLNLEWNSTYFCRFDFQIKHMLFKIKSRSFICCSQSTENNYFCPSTLLFKNIKWAVEHRQPAVFYIWTYKKKNTSWLAFAEVMQLFYLHLKCKLINCLIVLHQENKKNIQ